MMMPGIEPIFDSLIDFLRAGTWPESREVLAARPHLLDPVAKLIVSAIVDDPDLPLLVYPEMDDRRAAKLLRMHECLLTRCREVGVGRAFDEMIRDRPRDG
ncbi:hypothetical protein [Nonomuraea wenchangensis]|uniref:Uncharacterized protein n=1 Tax=Nonomuraea wenchangensis TaxID=568860 RepID=A0A1I0BYP1_9ACTN|nr:hypothetical protein [Nonomuraea wenchangensis]SET12139.1 hypothetical protein SAMN05421811_102111 [Nonomuraea wenchangensis]